MIYTSVIVPTYKRIEQTLQTIELLLSSSGRGKMFELEIIVSDGTPDSSLKNAVNNKFADRVIYTQPSSSGIAKSKNQGAKSASHEILIFCDSDMEVEPDTITKTLESLKNNTTAAAVGGTVMWKGGPKNGTYDKPRAEDRMIHKQDTTYIEALYSRYIATYKKVFFEVGGYDETVFNMRGEGSDLSIRYWRSGYTLTFDDKIHVHHVFEVEGGIIRNVPHPEYGIGKDMLLLAYKYDIFGDEYKNFNKTVAANFKEFGEDGYSRIIRAIGEYFDFIVKMKPIIQEQKKYFKPKYDFKFLEVFSNKNLIDECILQSEKKLLPIREKIFI